MSTVHKNAKNSQEDEPETDEHEDQDEDNDSNELALSPEAAAALRAFALSSGVAIDTSDNHEDNNDLLSAVRDHFDLKDRDETFVVEYHDNDDDDMTTNTTKRHIRFEVQGVKRVLGQTLSSTGLTIWRAAEHLCDYMFHHPTRFQQRIVCELGCGLGMVSILLHKMSVAKSILATDGDEDTMTLLHNNLNNTQSNLPVKFDSTERAGVIARKVYWGCEEDITGVLCDYPSGFDCIIASDVIYEEEQVLPLISTVAALLARPSLSDQIPSQVSNQAQSTNNKKTPANTSTIVTATTTTTTPTTVTVLETAVGRAREIPHSMVNSPQPARILALAPTSPSQISQSNFTTSSQTNSSSSSNGDSNNNNSKSDPTPTPNTNPPEFILAFARRNVPIDRVLAAAGRPVEY